ncbi:hypothetical protein RND61_15570 [Streptomyces sp. TRM76323]|uniref:Uncharacterized protein n=1 Tax=Streptomyces tamarix TaxID=3078565 RepID=A0ABU3QM30_9ACTN|nr:hypothetical protein [Streptomyces tamarix]MDT9683467.1 hypothetical protein [Streptomyces tamarix]
MTPSLKIKSPSTNTVVSIPRGTEFTIFPWGFSEQKARYTKKGKVIVYRDALFRKGNNRFWKYIVFKKYPSAKSFLNSWNKSLVIENGNGMEDYWDIAIYEKYDDNYEN